MLPKKVIVLIFLCLLCGQSAFASGEVGEYMTFGDYRGYDVSYYIAEREDVNADGVEDYLIIASNIIMYKATDPKTNVWRDTALRQWLNSDEKSVSWQGNIPDSSGVSQYPYESEAGFLSDENMSCFERSLILPVTHKSIYPKADGADGGTENWKWNDGGGVNYRLALQNYDDAYYCMTTDKVFLPSVKELVALDIPIMNASAAESAGEESSNCAFLLRDATDVKVRRYYAYNRISVYAVNYASGIRPMMYIDGNALLCGNGTAESPYYVKGSDDGEALVIKSCTKTVTEEYETYTVQIKNRSQLTSEGYIFAGIYDSCGKLDKLYNEKVSITSARSSTAKLSVPINEIKDKKVKVFYWDALISPVEIHNEDMTEEGEFVLNSDMYMENPDIRVTSSGNYNVKNLFDENTKTHFCIANLLADGMIFSFKYPAKISSVSFQSIKNGDWATVKKMDIFAYNDEQVYREKVKDPVFIGSISLENTSYMQTFELSEKLSGITHLILQPTEIYKTSTNAVWGGFSEMRICGSLDENEILTEKTVLPKLASNEEIFRNLGVDLPNGVLTMAQITEIMSRIGFDIQKSSSSDAMSANEFYNLLAKSMGYEETEFFELGACSLIGIDELTDYELGIGILEGLMTPVKGEDVYFVQKLYQQGKFNETAYIVLLDKLDAFKAAHMSEYTVPSNMKTDSVFSFSRKENPKLIMPANFSYNMPFHYEGGYLGTLPEGAENSKREEFSKALKTAGVKSLRFPGGLCAHQYFTEGEEYIKKLSVDIRKFGGLYDIYSKNSNYCIDFYNFLDFCKENVIEPIFQVNTSFYVEPSEDKIYAITKNKYVADSEGNVNADYYDRDRIEEAAEALGLQIDKMLDNGYRVKYWELGNEDFYTMNYLGTELEDNPATDNYVAISAAFAKVIKQKIPEAVVIATAGFPNLEEKYDELGVKELMDYISKHYPFANWTTPASADRDNLTRLLTANEQDFISHANGYKGTIPQCTTETSVWKFENCEGKRIQNTFAMALNTAHQWGELVFETPWEISTLHDLESPFFGAVLYNKKFDPETRAFVYRDSDMRIASEDIVKDYKFYDEYMVNPSGKAMRILSEHTGAMALTASENSSYRLVSAFASEKDEKVTVTVVNKMNTSKNIEMNFNGITFDKQLANGCKLSAKTLSAMIPREYSEEKTELCVEQGSKLSFEAEPYSIYQFVVNIN